LKFTGGRGRLLLLLLFFEGYAAVIDKGLGSGIDSGEGDG